MEEKVKTLKRPRERLTSTSKSSKSQRLKEVWLAVHKGMVKIFEFGEELNNDEYMKLYSIVYDFCNSGDGDGEPNNKCGRYSTAQYTTEHHFSSILYGVIHKYLCNRVKFLERLMAANINADTNENSKLQFYTHHSETFFRGAKQLNGICQAMNRVLTKFVNSDEGCRKTGTFKFHPIIYLPNMLWKSSSLYSLGKDVTSYIIKLIGKERDGKSAPQKPIVLTISSLLKLGYDPIKIVGLFAYTNSNETSKLLVAEKAELRATRLEEIELTTYREIFEAQFLKETSAFYANMIFVSKNCSSVEYVNLIQSWVSNELTRAKKYCIHPTTEIQVVENLLHQAVGKQHEIFFNGISEIFAKNNPREQLGLSNICEFLSTMNSLITANTYKNDRKVFLGELESRIAAVISERFKVECEKDKKKENDAHFYIDTFLEWFDDLKIIFAVVLRDNIHDQFGIVKNVIQCVLKENFITIKLKRPSKSNENFGFMYHIILTAKNKNEEEKLKTLNRFNKLFELLPDQLGFVKCYRMLLAKRLMDKTFNEKLEYSVIKNFDDVCGSLFTSRLKGLIEDATSGSKTFFDGFKKSLKGNPIPFEFNIALFSHVNSPWKSEDDDTFKICPALSPVCQSVEKYYIESKSNLHKKLQWLHSLSTVEIEVTNWFEEKKSYTITCSAYQMTILSMYNSEDEITFAKIVKVTGLKESIASRAVNQLLKSKLLLLEKSVSSSKSNDLQKEDKISLNRAFTRANARVVVTA